MGVLDDAIREHLELKRKHGVPEEEVERQQEEALGPARREVAQQPEDAEIAADEAAPAVSTEGGEATAAGEAALFDGEQSGAPLADEPPGAGPAPAAEETALAEPPATEHGPALAEPAAAEPPAPEPPADEERTTEPPVADHTGMEPAPVDGAPSDDPLAADEPDREPGAYDALGDTEPHGFPALEDDEEQDEDEDLVASDPEQDDPDLLEDTPDFLQETPEHDRLWFEQKPPRDFDFD
jgi:hypothetical protein